jgi:hypothetical protein
VQRQEKSSGSSTMHGDNLDVGMVSGCDEVIHIQRNNKTAMMYRKAFCLLLVCLDVLGK